MGMGASTVKGLYVRSTAKVIYGREKLRKKEKPGEAKYTISVQTGDKKGSGTDAKVHMILHGKGQYTDIVELNKFLKNDFEANSKDSFPVSARALRSVDAIELWRDDSGVADEWFVNIIEVKISSCKQLFLFPVYRWIKPNVKYKIFQYDTCLPQHDQNPQHRSMELEDKKKMYLYETKYPGCPVQVKDLPEDEKFSFDYQFDISKHAIQAQVASVLTDFLIPGQKWKDLDHIKCVYKFDVFPEPNTTGTWKEDENFGRQRIASVNHSVIALFKEIPKKLPVTEEMLKPILEGETISSAIEHKRLFIVDLEICKDVATRDGYTFCAPIALFFVNTKQRLIPVAIQLNQEPGSDNPVFLPSDPEYTWMMAKMWFNNADANYHQSITHLGFTHLLMESFAVATQRNLSQSHPLYKLLAPHFLYVMAINSSAGSILLSEGGWIDQVTNIGTQGATELIQRRFREWKLEVDGILPFELQNRGVMEQEVLPGYFYRNDALAIYEAIFQYVKKYVTLYYDTQDAIDKDWELREWLKELSNPPGGECGILGIPVDGKIEKPLDLINILSCVIFTCSAGHAATNFPQYTEYGFPPNYPLCMCGKPPTDKKELTEEDILAAIPDQSDTVNLMKVASILSERATKSLGDFEVNYIYDPAATGIVKQFRDDLNKISKDILSKNSTRYFPYDYLDPKQVPNSISI